MPKVNLNRIKSVLYPPRPDFDPWQGLCTHTSQESPHVTSRCTLEQGHAQEQHRFVSIPHYQHYRAGGYFNRHLVFVPQDGNWKNFDFDNWKVVTKREYWQQLYQIPHRRYERGWFMFAGVWHKECSECLQKKPVEEFPKKRNRCNDCWTVLNRERSQAQYLAHKAEGCVVFKKAHFHIGNAGKPKTEEQKSAARALGLALYLSEPKKKRA